MDREKIVCLVSAIPLAAAVVAKSRNKLLELWRCALARRIREQSINESEEIRKMRIPKQSNGVSHFHSNIRLCELRVLHSAMVMRAKTVTSKEECEALGCRWKKGTYLDFCYCPRTVILNFAMFAL
jgi:hypothetical protein